VQEVTEELEAKLLEEQTSFAALQREKDDMLREFEEVKRQLEEDADRRAPGSGLHAFVRLHASRDRAPVLKTLMPHACLLSRFQHLKY
jgi:hypothetical protein